jgi:hypothetical protein
VSTLLEALRGLNDQIDSAKKARADEEFRETIHRGLGHPPKFSEHRAAWNAVDADPRTRALATRAVEMAAEDLGLGAVKIMWLPEKELPTAWGKASEVRPGVVYLRTDLPPDLAAEVAAHECRHLDQYARGRYAEHRNPHVKAAGEADATWYGERMAAKVHEALAMDELLEGLRAINGTIKAKAPAAPPCGCKKTEGSGWLTEAVQRIRAGYEREVCASPHTRAVAPFCGGKQTALHTTEKSTGTPRPCGCKTSTTKRSNVEAMRRILLEDAGQYERTVCSNPHARAHAPFCTRD